MGAVSKYWIWVRIDSFGKCQTTELSDIRAFVQQEFSQLTKSGDIPVFIIKKTYIFEYNYFPFEVKI